VGSWSEYVANVKSIPRAAWESLVRHGPPVTDRSRAEAVFQNLFLHIHSTRGHRWSLRCRTSAPRLGQTPRNR
jgi:hypothetical protein